MWVRCGSRRVPPAVRAATLPEAGALSLPAGPVSGACDRDRRRRPPARPGETQRPPGASWSTVAPVDCKTFTTSWYWPRCVRPPSSRTLGEGERLLRHGLPRRRPGSDAAAG